jgi:perosamine synthetase
MRTIPFGKPVIGEEEKKAVLEVLNGPILVHGPKAKEFEDAFAAFTAAGQAVSVSSCTAALHLSYFFLGIGKGDEVIVPAQTHAATAHAVELCGAMPVFVDAEPATGNIDISQIESAITDRTRAISVVHYLGMPVNMEQVMRIAQKRDLFVVEDCALAIGTYFKGVHAGLYGDIGCFSFYPVKHMTTAEGGMILTRHADVAAKISRQRAFGVDRHMGERSVPGVYDVTMLGFNYRMNEIEAAIGLEQLKKVPSFLQKRRQNYEVLSHALQAVEEVEQLQSSNGEYQSSYYCLSVLLNQRLTPHRFEIVDQLKQRGVGTSVYYPHPVPHLSYYKTKYGYTDGSYPVAARISNSSIALPVGPHLDEEDMAYIADSLKQAIQSIKK